MPTLHPIVERLLKERRIDEVDVFLNPTYHERPDPFLMKDMDKAVGRILHAIEKGEKIAAWTDYDCDGIPAGALLADFFKTIEYPVRSYIPERSEGYGLNVEGIQKLANEGVTLIVTADCGITDTEEVAFAKSLGVDVVVSDHHLPQETLPDAVAVLNPHRIDCGYPFKELCGTGVAFKLVEGLIQKGDFGLPEGFEKWLLDLVALATVADMVPLVGENRILVHYGLIVLKKGKRKGFRALLDRMRVPLSSVTEDDFSFGVAPKINAASRMESPMLGLELLTTEDMTRAEELAKKLLKLNDARKLEGARVSKEVKKRLEGLTLPEVIVMGNSKWNPALLGIAASGIVETYQKTVCLWGKDGELIKGSCRSNGSVNIVSLMSSAGGVFEDFGGHEASGGFSLKSHAIHTLPDVLESAYAQVKTEMTVVQEVEADSTLTLAEANSSLYDALRSLAPFGVGNKKPIFRFDGVRVEKVMWFGKHNEHAKAEVSDESGRKLDAISFFANRSSFRDTLELLSSGDQVVLDAALEESYFGGRKEFRLRLENITLS